MLLGALAGAAFFAGCGSKADDAAASAPPGAWKVDKANSRLEFAAEQTGKAFTGRFEDFEATIVFDADNLDAARIEVSVATGSARTGDRQRDDALPTADWFAAKEFPTATFIADKIVKTGEGAYAAEGALTLRGVSKPLTLPFTLAISGSRATADGATSLIRTDFGVGQGEFATDEWVGFDVEVAFHIEATR